MDLVQNILKIDVYLRYLSVNVKKVVEYMVLECKRKVCFGYNIYVID